MQPKRAKQKIEGIYPLSFLQQTLLFHSLHEDDDQGFLQVKCVLKGSINLEAFKKAWRETFQRHESLRTSIHWENLENPVQVIHKETKLPFTFYDWSEFTSTKQHEKFALFKEKDKQKHLDLSAAPVLRVTLIKLSEDNHYLLWSCHHILVDGWSGSIILKDLFEFYDSNSKDVTASMQPIPSYKSYLNWIQNQDKTKAQTFWKQMLRGFEVPTLIGEQNNSDNKQENIFRSESLLLSENDTNLLRDIAQKYQVTLNTLIRGIWSLLLCRYLNRNDIAFGTTVSGRNIDIPNAELMSGMFMNVLPMRMVLDQDESLSNWLKSLQKTQAKIQNYEYVNLSEILSWSDSSNNSSLFDSLIVFQNIPLENMSGGGVTIGEFESRLTSTYPLTLSVVPSKKLEFHIKYNSSLLSKKTIDWWTSNISALVKSIDNTSIQPIKNVLSEIPSCETTKLKTQNNKIVLQQTKNHTDKTHAAPRNKIELGLVKIWEKLFDRKSISISDDFFEIGGRSLIAVRMFAQIEMELGSNLPPTTLLQHPTIKEIAKLIKNDDSETNWSTLVPLHVSGSKPPLFCFHAGGGLVMFYKALADYLDSNQPVYGIQPMGLDGVETHHQTIEEMASRYLTDIKKVQPNGPYVFLGYCFSNALCLEMAHQLKKNGEPSPKIVIIDSHPRTIAPDKDITPTFFEKVKSYKKLFQQKNWHEIFERQLYKFQLTKIIILDFFNKYGIKQTNEIGQNYNLLNIQQSLKMVYENYDWKPYDGDITLILAADFDTRPWGKVILAQWKTIVQGKVHVSFASGSHTTLFDEPEVQGLATQLQQCLDEFK